VLNLTFALDKRLSIKIVVERQLFGGFATSRRLNVPRQRIEEQTADFPNIV
jgi:hypothetical protein